MAESKEEAFNLFYPWFYQGEMMSDIENYISALKKGDDTLKSNKQELIRLHNERLILLQEERIQEERRRMEGIIKEDANHCLPRW